MKKLFQALAALLCTVLLAALLPTQALAAEEPALCAVLHRGNPLYPEQCTDDFTWYGMDAGSVLLSDDDEGLPTFATAEEAGTYVRREFKARSAGMVFLYSGLPADGPYAELTDEETNAAYSEYEQALINEGKTRADILRIRRFSKYMGSLLVDILEATFRHDLTDPTGGDYMLYQFASFSLGYAYDGSTLGIELHFTYYTTAEQEADVDSAAKSLIDYLALDGKSDYEKLYAIYQWICNKVTYDNDNLSDSDYTLKYTAYAALIDKSAVCQGYAVLLYRLALMAGIDARIVTGTANSGGHAWNIVRLGDLWYYVDTTWDTTHNAVQSGYWPYFLKSSYTDHTLDEDGSAVTSQYPMASTDFVYHTPGDVNGTNQVDIRDVQALYAYLTTGSIPENALSDNEFRLAADVNNDHVVDVYDLQWLYESVALSGTQ